MTTLTVHEALNRLKIYDARIKGLIENFTPVALRQQGKLAGTSKTVAAFEKEARATFEQITALINNRRRLKLAVITSNAATVVTIGGVKMTVAEAIEFRKVGLEYLKALSARIEQSYRNIDGLVSRASGSLSKQAEESAIAFFGQSADKKSDDFTKFIAVYLENNSASIFDPINVPEALAELRRQIDQFSTEVDTVLTTANVNTVIEVELSGV
jgi:hypothetical protein